MELLLAGYEIIEQQPGLDGIYKAIELPGRICYGSQDKICEGSARKFVEDILMKNNHGAPMEHGTVYLKCPQNVWKKYVNNKYSYTTSKPIYEAAYDCDRPFTLYDYYVTTNFRVLFENGWLDDLQYRCEPTEGHVRRIQVRFTIDRFTGEEFLRHRPNSFNRESTRFVNFCKKKFGNGSIKYILPIWLHDRQDIVEWDATRPLQDFCKDIAYGLDEGIFTDIDYWVFALKSCEYSYNNLIRLGWVPEQARTVLPCAINSPLIVTASMPDWIHFFNLRAIGTTGKPHPQAKELAEPLMHEFLHRGYIKNDDGALKMNEYE